MQKTDPMREQAHARASAQAPNATLARLKARSLGKAGPDVPALKAGQHKPLEKPLIR